MSPCPICTQPTELWCQACDHHYGNRGVWSVYRCTHCRHLFQHPLPQEEHLRQFYPASYYAFQPPLTDFAPHGLHHRGVWLKLHYLKYFRGYQHLRVSTNPLLAYLGYVLDHRPLHFDAPNFQSGGVLLDYGAGTGTTVALAQYLGWTAEGIEINPSAAKTGQDAGIHIDTGSIATLEERANRYIYILSSHCVEHVPDVCRLFRAFFRALKPGGTLAIDVPNADSLAAERFRELYYYLGMPVHAHLFTPASISALSLSTGFVDISIRTYSSWYTQAESAVMSRRLRLGHATSVHASFRSHGQWEGLLGRIRSLPTYLKSRIQSRGDCLVMTCVKPAG